MQKNHEKRENKLHDCSGQGLQSRMGPDDALKAGYGLGPDVLDVFSDVQMAGNALCLKSHWWSITATGRWGVIGLDSGRASQLLQMLRGLGTVRPRLSDKRCNPFASR